MIRASQDAVVSALGDRGGVVSPTSASGWTAAWIDDPTPLPALGDGFAIEGDENTLTLQVVADRRSGSWTWNVDDTDVAVPVLAEAARALGAVVARTDTDTDTDTELRHALAGAECADELIDDLVRRHHLPHPWGPVPRRAVTLQRGDPAAARLAARIVARDVGSIGLAALPGGWSVIRAEAGPDAQGAVTMSVAAGLSSRRGTVLALWRGEGGAAGFEVASGDGVAAEGRWNTGWRDLGADRREARDAAAQVLAQAAGGSAVNLVALRALLRSRTWNGDPLAELVALLEVPDTAVRVLDGSAGDPGLRTMKPAPLWRLVWEAIRDRGSGPWITTRWLRNVIAGYAFLAALVALGAAAAKYAAVATGDAFLDHDGVFAIVFTVAVPLNLWCAVQMFRRGTFF